MKNYQFEEITFWLSLIACLLAYDAEILWLAMKMRKQKKQIPADFRKQMYENYKANMAFYGKPISSYKQWLKDIFNTKIPTK